MIFTYDVKWEPSTITWEHRWDVYLHGNPNDEIHYFSIVNSLMIVLFLTGVVAMIMLRTLRKDISTYNEIQTLEEAQEESGWKLVHGDVFRPPSTSPMLLSVLVGTHQALNLVIYFYFYFRNWTTIAFNDVLHYYLRVFGLGVSGKPRCLAHSSTSAVCLHGIDCWLCFCKSLQAL